MIAALQAYVVGGLLIIGSLFALTASVGLLRLPDFYTRTHAASKAGTLGSCVMLIALALHSNDFAVAARALAGVAFFILTVPISSHLLAKASYDAGYPLWKNSVGDALEKSRNQIDDAKSGGEEGDDAYRP